LIFVKTTKKTNIKSLTLFGKKPLIFSPNFTRYYGRFFAVWAFSQSVDFQIHALYALILG
jgi:hypothetical protein